MAGRFFAATMLLVAASCGDDQPPSTTPPDADFGDFQPPRVIAAEPDDSERAVSVLTPITVTFEEPLTSVSSATVELRVTGDEAAEVVAGDVSYDDTSHTIRFTPVEPLRHGRHYSLILGDFKDLVGNVFVGQTIAFTTTINETTKAVSYTGGAIREWYGATLDANGRARSTVRHDTPGADGQWLSADDHAAARLDVTRTSVDLVGDVREYGAGADGAIGTADDVVTTLERHRFDGSGRQTDDAIYIGAGPDATWGNADDAMGSYQTKAWMGLSRIQVNVIDHPGVDAMWRTADDAGPQWTAYSYDDLGRLVRELAWSTRVDRVAGTADDVILSHVDHSYDALGRPLRVTVYTGAGSDGVWNTADDDADHWQNIEHDMTGLLVATTEVASDQTITSRAVHAYAATRLRTSVTVYSGPGVDAAWGTADDVIASLWTTSYDDKGNRTDERRASNPGVDAVWGTADDVLDMRSEFDLMH